MFYKQVFLIISASSEFLSLLYVIVTDNTTKAMNVSVVRSPERMEAKALPYSKAVRSHMLSALPHAMFPQP